MARPQWTPTPEILEKAESYAALGLTKEQIASCLGIGERTLYEKVHDCPQFAQAIKRGLDKGISRMANLLVKHAEAGNSSSVIFFLKARAKWSDNAAIDDLHAKIDKVMEKMGEKQNAKELDQGSD
jgi:hypothetical protein